MWNPACATRVWWFFIALFLGGFFVWAGTQAVITDLTGFIVCANENQFCSFSGIAGRLRSECLADFPRIRIGANIRGPQAI